MADREENLVEVLIDGKVNWVFGYTRAVNWLGSLLLELAIVESLVGTTGEFDEDEALLLDVFSAALSKFNPDAAFGGNDEPLRDCIRLVQRAKFKHYPADLTSNVAAIAWG